eukprot:3815898-Rhodomonas_salina.1
MDCTGACFRTGWRRLFVLVCAPVQGDCTSACGRQCTMNAFVLECKSVQLVCTGRLDCAAKVVPRTHLYWCARQYHTVQIICTNRRYCAARMVPEHLLSPRQTAQLLHPTLALRV